MIKKVKIENFRSIKNQEIELKNYTIFIGDNGTGKTSFLEAINFALSPSFLSGRIKHTDFYNGEDNPINIEVEFKENLKAQLPDGYVKQEIPFKQVLLKIKFRGRKAPEKAFSDLVVIEHRIEPSESVSRTANGWSIKRKGGSDFNFRDHLLALSIIETEDLPRSFYFNKGRDKQLQRGFNSSINTVFDDFNWRFLKNERSKDFFSDKNKIEKEKILDLIDIKENVFNKLNGKLKIFGIEEVDISFIDGKSPFNNAFLSRKKDIDLPVKYLGSGVEMIISLMFLETMASMSKEKLVILIDEPELHLHPSLQYKLSEYLENISKNHQVIVSTHSPIFFKNCIRKENIQLLVANNENGEVQIKKSEKFGLFPWSPSWGEINYFAFNHPTIEFHDELYGYLQEKSEKYKQSDFEKWLADNGIQTSKKWTREKNGQPQQEEDVTLPTFIRNKVHHPENQNMRDQNFSDEELKNSIELLINIVKNHHGIIE
ncbi:MAG: ATPase protein [Deferribacteraceae bacterium]|jgi:predicted ATP-dependent endonuclease of OLD family|nr:ATPase protein [Deferribacteraceae bacterium]